MKDFIWQPRPEDLSSANIARFMKKEGITDPKVFIQKSSQDIEWFWNAALQDLGVEWFTPYSKLVEGGLPFATWFAGGKINIVHNCLDRHQKTKTKDQLALIWEGDCGAVVKWTYAELFERVNRLANALKGLGVKPGDACGIYMPMIPEMLVAFFATLKIGGVIVPIFSGFGPEPASIRLADANAKILFTADYGLRRGKKIATKAQADAALEKVPSIEHVIVAKRLFEDVPWIEGRDLWMDELVANQSAECASEVLDAEARSIVIHTSGTTGKPKGCVHTHAGILAQIAKETGYTMDTKPGDVFFWLTDIGWMMGPWEFIGTAFHGGTLVLFEGAPDYPDASRVWSMIERHKINILGISPTAIRLLKKFPLDAIQKHNLSSLRILGSTGEAWDPESYQWYFEHVGGKRCPIMNISGGTEIMGCHLAPLPVLPLKSCSLGGPSLGMDIDILDEDGKSVKQSGEVGYLVCKKPAPSMTKGFLNDKQRYLDTYFSKWPTTWNHGDWAVCDADGQWFLRGRADDVIKVSGHRTGPAEIESAIMENSEVAECAAIGVPHAVKGESITVFAVLKDASKGSEDFSKQLKENVVKRLGKTLVPDVLVFVNALPKTRSAKIVRGVIRKKYLGLPLGDLSSVDNLDALDGIPKQL